MPKKPRSARRKKGGGGGVDNDYDGGGVDVGDVDVVSWFRLLWHVNNVILFTLDACMHSNLFLSQYLNNMLGVQTYICHTTQQ